MDNEPITGTALHVLNFLRAEHTKNQIRWWTHREIGDAVSALHGDLDVLTALNGLANLAYVETAYSLSGGTMLYRAEAP